MWQQAIIYNIVINSKKVREMKLISDNERHP